MNYRVKMVLRKFIPGFVFQPVLNTARFLNAIFNAPTNNFVHLQELHDIWLKINKSEINQENTLRLMYQELLPEKQQKEEFRLREFRTFSQNGEDGILLYILSKIGIGNRTFIEFGAGGKSSNTGNLIANFGFTGLLIDGDKTAIEELQNQYAALSQGGPERIKARRAWLTTENINQLFLDNGMKGEIDVLSIDIDGNDYWIWQAINIVQPRVVVIEYNGSIGPVKSCTIKYNSTHAKLNYHPLGWYHGASLTALAKLGKEKGYVLVATESSGINAFFVRNDLVQDIFLEQMPTDAYYEDTRRAVYGTQEEQYEQIKKYDFVEV